MYELYGSENRSRISRIEFLRMSRLGRYPLLAFEVIGEELDGHRASVTVSYESEVPFKGSPRFETDITYDWVLENGEWGKAGEEMLLLVP